MHQSAPHEPPTVVRGGAADRDAPRLETLRACQTDLTAKLKEAEAGAKTSLRASTHADMLGMALRDVKNGPDLVSGGEFMTDVLVQWLKEHAVSPLPGECGTFSGRGGLISAETRYSESLRTFEQARSEVVAELTSAKQFEVGRGAKWVAWRIAT